MASQNARPQRYENDNRPGPSQHKAQDHSDHFKIARKPIDGTTESRTQYAPTSRGVAGSELDEFRELNIAPPALPPRPGLTVQTKVPGIVTDPTRCYESAERTTSTISTRSPSGTLSAPTTPGAGTSPASSPLRKAFSEAQHFAGGLIARPIEDTKHFTILRHSHGLVFYQGASTTLAISIFSDQPLPADRTIWLQGKGWSGNAGMRLKALVGRNGSWHDVTPSARVLPEQLEPSDERAWQRDIKKLQKKKNKGSKWSHELRETAIVRIPAEAGDGYFSLLLCLGEKRKVLCPSPTFRVLSTSASPHSIRGAGLSTLPFEIGAMALGIYAKNTAGLVVSPIASVVQSQVQAYMPSFWTQEAATTAYSVSGIANKVDAKLRGANNQYEKTLGGAYVEGSGQDLALDLGPQSPYPLQFTARVDPHGSSVERTGSNIINLTGLPESTTKRYHGYYFGWARFVSSEKKPQPLDAQDSWIEAIMSALPIDITQLTRVDITTANKRLLTLQLLCEPDELPILSASASPTIELLLLGFLRPDEPLQRAHLAAGLDARDAAALEAAAITAFDDVSFAQSILAHPAWTPEAVARSREDAPRPSMAQRVRSGYAEGRGRVERGAERVPLGRLGVRGFGEGGREGRGLVVSGFYVVR